MCHFIILQRLLSKFFKHTHLMAVKMMGILTVFAIYLMLKKTGDDPRRYLFVKR